MAEQVEVGDIVQIVDEEHHWYPALITVSELKSFGCQGYMISVTSNDPAVPNNPAFIRLQEEKYERVGRAVVVLPHHGSDNKEDEHGLG